MEFCDLGSLLRAVTKKAFKPHGKWSYHTTYVSLSQSLITPSVKTAHALSTKGSTLGVACGVTFVLSVHLLQLMQACADWSVCVIACTI